MKKMPGTEEKKKLDPRWSFEIREGEASSGQRKRPTKRSRAQAFEPKRPMKPIEMFMMDLKKQLNNNPSVNYEQLALDGWKLMPESGRARYQKMWKMHQEEYDQAMNKYMAQMSANGDSESEEESEEPGLDTPGDES